MAITQCRECGKQVSTEAAACPHCGVAAPGTGERKTSVGQGSKLLRWLFGGWTLLWMFLFVQSCSGAAETGSQTAGAEAGTGLAIIFIFFLYFGIWFVGAIVLYFIRRMVVD